MENVKKLFQLLDKWKHNYVFASVLLIIATAIRMLEPKVLQVTGDKIVAYFTVSSDSYKGGTGMITTLFNSMLPELRTDNLHIILIWLGLIFLFISLLRGVFTFSSSAISASSTEKAIKKLRDRLFSHLQALPLAYHSKTPTGELIQRCTGDVETVRKFASIQVVDVLRLLTIFIAAFIMMYGINIIYSLIAVALVPVIAVGSVIFFKKESEIWTKHEKEQDKLSIIVQENLSGIRVVKAFAKEKYEIEKFTNQNETKRQWGIKLLKLHAFFWPFSDFLVYTQMSISVFAGAYFALNGVITVGELTAFYSYAMLVTWPLRRVGQVVAEMGMTTVAIKRIFSILDFQAEDRTGINENGYGKLKGEIEFRNISFRYPDGNEKHVLNDISFKIKPGEKSHCLDLQVQGNQRLYPY